MKNSITKNINIDDIVSLIGTNEQTKPLFDINLDTIQLGMSEFQISNFVLNKKEFATPFFIFQQTKMELYSRIQVLIDLYYQYKTTILKIKLSEGKIEELEKETLNQKIKEARIGILELEIDKHNLAIVNIKRQITDKIRESDIFYKKYKELEYIESLPEEELKKLEEESWKTKSLYYPEMTERYALTPDGFLELPHENKKLLDIYSLYTNKTISNIKD